MSNETIFRLPNLTPMSLIPAEDEEEEEDRCGPFDDMMTNDLRAARALKGVDRDSILEFLLLKPSTECGEPSGGSNMPVARWRANRDTDGGDCGSRSNEDVVAPSSFVEDDDVVYEEAGDEEAEKKGDEQEEEVVVDHTEAPEGSSSRSKNTIL